METVRVFFRKTGRLKYISHLDIIRCISRVFNRCDLPIWFTQGFNPHPYLTFALPLSLGFDSCCESFDFRLTEPVDFETVCEKMNALLPSDLQVIRAATPVMKPEAICWADYSLSFFDEELADLYASLSRFVESEHIEVTKKTKRGEKTIDLKETLQVLSLTQEADHCELSLRLPAGGTLNVSPLLLTGAFFAEWGREPYWMKMERTAILDKDFCDFM